MESNVNTRMDEGNKQTVQRDSEEVPKDFDLDASLKGTADDDPDKLLPRKSSSDILSSETVIEANASSTNGIDNELVKTHLKAEDVNFTNEPRSELKSLQSNENEIKSEEKISNINIHDKLDVGTSAVNKQFKDGAKDLISNIKETDKEINVENNFSVIDSLYSFDNNIRNSNGEEASSSNEKNMGSVVHPVVDVIFQQDVPRKLSDDSRETENVGSREQNNITDLNIDNEPNKDISRTTESNTIDLNEEVQRVINTEIDTIKADPHEVDFVNSETCEEKMDVSSTEIIEEKAIKVSEKECEENFPKPSPMIIDADLCVEINDSQEGKKSDGAGQNDKDKEKSNSSVSEDISFEIENENQDSQNKGDCVPESSSSQSNANTSNLCAEQDEECASRSENDESANKSENDGIEVMDTEMVNCNEIEQIDLIENESQKDREVDRIGIEPSEADSKGDQKDKEMMIDSPEISAVKFCSEEKATETFEDKIYEQSENQKETLVESEAINQPGNSEEETITGDTSHQVSSELAEDKEEEVCIIPDDMTPRLSILSQKDQNKRHVKNKSEIHTAGASPIELEKSKTVRENKKKEVADNVKSRPVRNAAKLAGNKIKSLVQNDLVYDEQVSGVEAEGDMQENSDGSSKMCAHCKEVKVCKFLMAQGDGTQYVCSENCSIAFTKSTQTDAETNEIDDATGEYIRKCGHCYAKVTADDRCLFWETMDFCNEDCLGKYQTELGSCCANCKGSVLSTSLGKYCVRFGYDVKQFCTASCLEEYKKGLKVCSYCQKDISTGGEGFLAPVGDKGQFKDFCTPSCMEKYERMSSNVPLPDVIEECAVCSNSKPVRVEVELDNKTHKLCSEPCFAAFKFVNNITEGQCDMCRKYFDRVKSGNYSLFFDETPHTFCCKTCMNVYILANRKIVPCNWCKVKKYNFDMIKKVSANGQLSMMCSLNCLMRYQVSVNAVCSRRIKCDFCLLMSQAQYHLKMSDTTIRNFCSYNCVMSFQNRYPKQAIISGSERVNSPIPIGVPKRITPRRTQVEPPCVPVISSVQSLASPNGPASPSGRVPISRADVSMVTQVTPISQSITIPTTVAPMPAPPPPQIYQQIVTKPAQVKVMKNKSVLCKPYSHTKGVSCRPHPCMKETQTDQSLNRKFLIPIPIPIYVPAPMHMFATPFPVPVPFPLPVPVPIFIPTTRNSAKGIFKEIKKIQEKIPTDPFEAELLMMAEMVAGEKKQDPTDSESEDGNDGDDGGDGTFSPENVDTSNTFGDDMLQMALKMASELEEPAVDMESVLTSNTITTSTQPSVDPNKALYSSDPDDPDQVHVMSMNRGRKRSIRGSRNSAGGPPSKRGRRTSGSVDVPLLPPPEPVAPPRIEVEKPDANMCLKYTFGVNAWRHWVMQKNAELEKVALTNRKIKLFKPELLQLTADELNFSLCLFVKEVRKPNGTEYAPDTIYYLCLGIQQYLFENGRIDNIFTDSYYEKFTDCLDEVAKKFAALYNDSQYIVTRVEEEHLWESKQLGAHSPHVLLSTLMFFNTKHFNLVTVEEHMQLSFSHIMKHWKRNPNTPGVAKVPGSRNVLLRFYPPQSALEANSRKKKVYEQQENEENPLRCPVKLYEFYLSKCPESVKTRNDVFYLLPERSCVPDSPVWYSTMALGKEPLMKMLHRVKMVKEINIALLTC